MKVKKLIAKLLKLDQEKEITVASDAEGNSIYAISDLSEDTSEENSLGYIIWPSHDALLDEDSYD